MKIHSGEKSTKCNQCNYTSSHAGTLRRHLKTHSGEKPNKWNQYDFASTAGKCLLDTIKKKNKQNYLKEKSLSTDFSTDTKIFPTNHQKLTFHLYVFFWGCRLNLSLFFLLILGTFWDWRRCWFVRTKDIIKIFFVLHGCSDFAVFLKI